MERKIEALGFLGRQLKLNNSAELKAAKIKSYQENNWFIEENINFTLNAIADQFLDEEKIRQFVDTNNIVGVEKRKIVGVIPAGNIPMVGFHDVLCIFLSGHIAMIKSSKKDEYLTKTVLEILTTEYPEFSDRFQFVDKLSGFDSVIATGSNNTSRYFDYYFKDYPSIIRKNRSSISILSGEESEDDLRNLGNDVFLYFGLGCRNVSKVYVPEGFEITKLFELWTKFDHYKNHHKFRNNFEYNNANFLLNQESFLTNDVFILKENSEIVSRISVLHYEFYQDVDQLLKTSMLEPDALQCVSTNLKLESMPLVEIGSTQLPSLHDFADGVNTVLFLQSI